ncbi:hypothetical protein Droror1_Dr00002167 [Drosera rotundifolia]
MGKKKRPNGDHHAGDTTPPQTSDPITGDASHPIPKKTRKRKNQEENREEKRESKPSIPTVSIAVPGSVIDNAQSLELATRLSGQIALLHYRLLPLLRPPRLHPAPWPMRRPWTRRSAGRIRRM